MNFRNKNTTISAKYRPSKAVQINSHNHYSITTKKVTILSLDLGPSRSAFTPLYAALLCDSLYFLLVNSTFSILSHAKLYTLVSNMKLSRQSTH